MFPEYIRKIRGGENAAMVDPPHDPFNPPQISFRFNPRRIPATALYYVAYHVHPIKPPAKETRLKWRSTTTHRRFLGDTMFFNPRSAFDHDTRNRVNSHTAITTRCQPREFFLRRILNRAAQQARDEVQPELRPDTSFARQTSLMVVISQSGPESLDRFECS